MGTVTNLYIDQGATYNAIVQVFDDDDNPFNLTGYTANAQIRKNYSSSSVSAEFTANVLSISNGTISLSLTSSQTGNLKYGRYVYDVEITSNLNILRPIEGIVVVYPQVTR